MDGIEKYIAKYGRHLTNKLADTTNTKWCTDEIEKASAPLVYYNVSQSTIGDIAFLANLFYRKQKACHPYKQMCIKYALSIIENINAEGIAFELWLSENKGFDLEKYI